MIKTIEISIKGNDYDEVKEALSYTGFNENFVAEAVEKDVDFSREEIMKIGDTYIGSIFYDVVDWEDTKQTEYRDDSFALFTPESEEGED